MKKWMIIFFILLVYVSTAFGDSAGGGGGGYDTHIVTTDVLITNLDQYPDIVLLVYADNYYYENNAYMVRQNQPLPQGGYWSAYGARNLLAIKKSILEAEGGVAAIDMDVLKQKYTPAVVIEPIYDYAYDDNPLASQTYRYEITSVTPDKVSLRLYQGVFTFIDGRKPAVVYYTADTVPLPKP